MLFFFSWVHVWLTGTVAVTHWCSLAIHSVIDVLVTEGAGESGKSTVVKQMK